jgi:dihydrofolate reductase
MPKYVVSGTLTDPEWNNTRVLSGDLVEEVTRLTKEVDGDISVAGSIRLVRGLLEHDLVDELHLMMFPVLLGTGRRLFGETVDKSVWRPTESTMVGEGVLIMVLQRTRDGGRRDDTEQPTRNA